jgi:hypothetical protein
LLHHVLPKVLDGTWKGGPDAVQADRMHEEVHRTISMARSEQAESLQRFLELEKAYPKLLAHFGDQKMFIFMRNGKFAEAETVFKETMTRAIKMKDAVKLVQLTELWLNRDFNPVRRNLQLAAEATEVGCKLAGPKDMHMLLSAAHAQNVVGNKAKSVEYAEQALEAAPDVKETRDQIQSLIRRYKR